MDAQLREPVISYLSYDLSSVGMLYIYINKQCTQVVTYVCGMASADVGLHTVSINHYMNSRSTEHLVQQVDRTGGQGRG